MTMLSHLAKLAPHIAIAKADATQSQSVSTAGRHPENIISPLDLADPREPHVTVQNFGDRRLQDMALAELRERLGRDLVGDIPVDAAIIDHLKFMRGRRPNVSGDDPLALVEQGLTARNTRVSPRDIILDQLGLYTRSARDKTHPVEGIPDRSVRP